MKVLLRDTAIVWALTFLSGFIVGIAAGASNVDVTSMPIAIAVGNLVFSIVGFVIVGAMAKVNRFKHLTKVVFLLWIVGLTNLLWGFSLFHWLVSILPLFIAMGIGGGLSFLFAPAPSNANETAV